jgi:hypothetical protein
MSLMFQSLYNLINLHTKKSNEIFYLIISYIFQKFNGFSKMKVLCL